jgi:hypothetical protein
MILILILILTAIAAYLTTMQCRILINDLPLCVSKGYHTASDSVLILDVAR